MKTSYEAHITFTGTTTEVVHEPWKFSKIDGDPVLGKGVKCYLTRHYPPHEDVLDILKDMRNAAADLQQAGLTVHRMKLEKIVFDLHL